MSNIPDFIANNTELLAAYRRGTERAVNDLAKPDEQLLPPPAEKAEIVKSKDLDERVQDMAGVICGDCASVFPCEHGNGSETFGN